MNTEELRNIMDYLRERVVLVSQDGDEAIAVDFQAPTEEEMVSAGLNPDGVKRILNVPWWEDMIEDIIETPDMCDPEDLATDVLLYAKDVISEYIRKRFPLEEGKE